MDIDQHDILGERLELFVRQCTTLAGVVLLVYDILGCSKQEYNYFFRTPFTRIKGLYILSRYFGLTFQVASLIMVMGPLSREVPKHVCERWCYLNLVNIVFLLALIEFIIMLRVYALYQKSTFIGLLLACFAFTEIAVIVACALPAIPHQKYGTGCIVLEAPDTFGHAGMGIIITQVTTCGLAAWKYKFSLPEAWKNAPIVSLVMRDGALFHVGISASILILIPISVRVKDISFITLGFISCLSIVACRLILNMQQLKTPELSIDPDFTSVYELTAFDLSTPPSTIGSLNALGSSIP